MSKVFVSRIEGPYPRLEALASRLPFLRSVAAGLARDSAARRTPRSAAYMEQAASKGFPDYDPQRVVTVADGEASRVTWSSFDEIVLLWPDGNGTGWSRLERTILDEKRPSARVIVLNGRRRRFELDRTRWRRFRARRFVQKALVGELVFGLLFVVVTPWLWLADLVRGRG